jgi:hypothetical protein
MRNCPLVEKDIETRYPDTQSRWVFELDGHGTVLHSRAFSELAGVPAAGDPGFNFFEDLEGIEDMPQLRQRFRTFVDSRKATESFYLSSRGTAPTRVLLTKAFRSGTSPSPLVMMEIRNEKTTEYLGGYNGNTTFKLRRA